MTCDDCGASAGQACGFACSSHLCPCGNAATVAGRCDWCAAHDDCAVPAGVSISRAWLSAHSVASCDECGGRWIGWDCVCELAHDCATNPVTLGCVECDAPVVFVSDNPADPDFPVCADCCAAMGVAS